MLSKKLKNGPRKNIVDISFWRKFKRETGIDIDYHTFASVIKCTNGKIAEEMITNISGFKWPEALGYSAVTRFKPKPGKRMVDYHKSREAGALVYYTNFHSFGYSARLLWFTDQIAYCKNIDIYKFIPERKVSRFLAEQIFKGKVYNQYTYKDFKERNIRINPERLTKRKPFKPKENNSTQ